MGTGTVRQEQMWEIFAPCVSESVGTPCILDPDPVKHLNADPDQAHMKKYTRNILSFRDIVI